MVIMNQEEKHMKRNTSEDNDYVNYAVLVAALGGARLHEFTLLAMAAVMIQLKTWFFTLLIDTRKNGQDDFMRNTALGSINQMIKMKII